MSERFSDEINAQLCVDCRSPMFDDDEPDEVGRCSGCQDGATVGGYVSRDEAERIVLDMMTPPTAEVE
jgi:hypothetical protein